MKRFVQYNNFEASVVDPFFGSGGGGGGGGGGQKLEKCPKSQSKILRAAKMTIVYV